MSRAQTSLFLSEEEKKKLLRFFPDGIVAVDLETTGLSPLVDRVVEIAAVKLDMVGDVTTFHSLINPLIDIPPHTIFYHGLTNEMVAHAPTLRKPLKDFWDFCENMPMIAHNATFDLGYLIKGSHDFQMPFPSVEIFDSCRLARAALKNLPTKPENFKLSTLSNWAAFPLTHHQAMEDAFASLKITAKCFDYVSSINHPVMEKTKVFKLSQFRRSEPFLMSSRFESLKKLVQKQELLLLDYQGGTHPGIKRPVRPIGLMPLPQGAVLFGQCLFTGHHKSFLLKKIKAFSLLEACPYPRRIDHETNVAE